MTKHASTPTSTDGLTPAMAQYVETKQQHPDALLFYRMGDFYELFFDDAVATAAALDITLTRRGRQGDQDIPMCGVPFHAAESYIARLIRQGFKVAVCEQIEDPAEARKRKGKPLVRRAVARVITPGTLTEDTLLDARAHNYLAALAEAGGGLAVAWADVSTGDFHTQPVAAADLAALLARLGPNELLIAERTVEKPDLFEVLGAWRERLSRRPNGCFDSESGRRRLTELFRVETLDAFGAFTRPELGAAGAIVDYLELTQQGRLPWLERPRRAATGTVMDIDAATRASLELTRTLAGDRKGSLLATLDRTVTGPGARLLAARVAAPLTDPAAIAGRLEAVQFFVDHPDRRADLRDILRACPDVERSLSRLSVGRGGPRDLAAIRDGLAQATPIVRTVSEPAGAPLDPLPADLAGALADLGDHDALVERLTRALGPDLPLLARDGGFIAAGYAAELDELRQMRDESRRLIAVLQAKYVEATGITSLKIKHNNVLGYFVEVTPTHGDRLSTNSDFIHRQSLANAVRFTTTELAELEQKLASAGDKALALEQNLFDDLAGEILARAETVGRSARALAALDVAAGLAERAIDGRWCRPLVDDSLAFDIRAGRHPVVETALDTEPFVPNDCELSGPERGQVWLLTGPNMAGKSTFLRQNALIALMAQAGSFVPADHAHIGVVDRLFSRVGAADDLARGRSTFMVEMVETSAILNQAGRRALVILDEIGRGTATYDGLSIAWATVEYLHEVNGCRALFATHYHELTSLAGKLGRLSCHTVRVKEWQDQVVFLHEVVPGAADRSYGIHVARLAGLPPAVVDRAHEILETLETGEQAGAVSRLADDLPLFAAALKPAPAPIPAPAPALSAVEAALGDIDPDDLTPRAALDLVFRLKGLMG